MAKILLCDIENTPNVGYTWGKWEQDVIAFKEERYIMSIAWKWLHEREVFCNILPDFPLYKRQPNNNRALIRKFHGVISKADIIIAHNALGHDDPLINTEIVKHGLRPPPPHKVIDTLRVARRHFKFNSNKLDHLAAFLKVGRKLPHSGFQMWLDCMAGNMRAWRLMAKYNIHDVHPLLEGVYMKLRPWMTRHPDLSHYARNWNCPVCESPQLVRRGWSYTAASKRMRYRCKACGKWSLGPLIRAKKPWGRNVRGKGSTSK